MARSKKTPAKRRSNSSKAIAIKGSVKDAEFEDIGEDLDAAAEAAKDEVKTTLEEMEDSTVTAEAEVEAAAEDVPEDAKDNAPVAEDAAPEEAAADAAEDAKADETEVEASAEEAASEPEPEPEPEPVSTVAPEVIKEVHTKSGFFSSLLGGIVAAVLGFGGAIYFKAAEWPIFGGSDQIQELRGELRGEIQTVSEAQTSTSAALEAQISEVSEGQSQAVSALEARTATLEESTQGLEGRLDEWTSVMEVLPDAVDGELLPEQLQAFLLAQKSEVTAQREEIEAQQAELVALQESLKSLNVVAEGQLADSEARAAAAAAAEAKAQARGALNEVRLALASGDAFEASLPVIADAVDVPEALSASASGVPTQAALESEFSDLARKALSTSMKATAGEGTGDRLALFFKDQLGARSLAPRDGDDPDAVLSRAEASVKSGDIGTALETLTALPEAGQAELATWVEQARIRMEALAAFDTLTDALSAS